MGAVRSALAPTGKPQRCLTPRLDPTYPPSALCCPCTAFSAH